MNSLKTIFTKLEGREWDWFGNNDHSGKYYRWIPSINSASIEIDLVREENGEYIRTGHKSYETYSLADLLANKSWIVAVWGDEAIAKSLTEFEGYSVRAYRCLRDEGEQACISYILKTMKP